MQSSPAHPTSAKGQIILCGKLAGSYLVKLLPEYNRAGMQSGVELELIERLKKKQVEQQQALQELQDAMALTSR